LRNCGASSGLTTLQPQIHRHFVPGGAFLTKTDAQIQSWDHLNSIKINIFFAKKITCIHVLGVEEVKTVSSPPEEF